MTVAGARKECTGCADFGHDCCNSEPSILVEGVSLICPCRECIVKMICEDACEEFRHHTKLVQDQRYV